ncbi:MAG: ATP-grasp domain-containing protein, partial [Jatrophihabitantaceae bacterium]
MSESLLVLVESNTTGTGRMFCERARGLGLRPIAFVRDPARYPYLDQDGVDVRQLDTTDPDALLRAARQLAGQVLGVTSSSEYFIATASRLAGQLGLPHPDPMAVTACRNKAEQRALLRHAGLPGPDFELVRSPADAVAAAERIGWPVVVKPPTGSGSVGVRLCTDPAQVSAAAAAILAADLATAGIPEQDSVLVEQYLTGPEFSVECFDRQVIGCTAKHLGPQPYFVEVGHDFPAPLDEPATAELAEAALAGLAALGLGWGPAHVELRRTPAGPRIVEVNPRLAGGMIPRLVLEATGIDLIELTVARAAGLPVEIVPSRDRTAAIRFLLAARSGTLTEVSGLELARR